MSFSLAPWKYRDVSGGPIGRLCFRSSHLLDGRPVFDAFAYLSMAPNRETFHIYGSADGNGTHATKQGAVHRAISEAMERWAFHDTIHSRARSQLGFDLDPTTTGMAAFPGLSPRSARRFAYYEAVERWSVAQWWRRQLPHQTFEIPETPHLKGLEIETRLTDSSCVVLWTKVPGFEATAYGFAASHNREAAVHKALVELTRNVRVLGLHFGTAGTLPQLSSGSERRLVFFAGSNGHQLFLDRVAAVVSSGQIPLPPLLVDTPIVGPWSRYAHVWRCLFECLLDDDKDDTFFLF